MPSSLEESSLKRLRIFSSPTCVGLRYGHPVDSPRNFSWKPSISNLPLTGRHGVSGIAAAPFHRTRHPYAFGLTQPPVSSPSFLRPSSVQRLQDGAGILTCLPSPTPFGLGLGPANPGKINLTQETLGLRRGGFSPPLSLLISASALPVAPPALSVELRRNWDAPLPPCKSKPA